MRKKEFDAMYTRLSGSSVPLDVLSGSKTTGCASIRTQSRGRDDRGLGLDRSRREGRGRDHDRGRENDRVRDNELGRGRDRGRGHERENTIATTSGRAATRGGRGGGDRAIEKARLIVRIATRALAASRGGGEIEDLKRRIAAAFRGGKIGFEFSPRVKK